MAPVDLPLKGIEALMVREVMFTHAFHDATQNLGSAADHEDFDKARAGVARLAEIAGVIDQVGWDLPDADPPARTVTMSPTAHHALETSLHSHEQRIAGEMGENAIEIREGHRRLSIIYAIYDRIDGNVGQEGGQ